MSSSQSNERGLRIARERIRKEAEEQTGVLDLGQLGLVEPPDELFELTHLETLNLGDWFQFNDKERDAREDIAPNAIGISWQSLTRLTNLHHLSVASCEACEPNALTSCIHLRSLIVSDTHVADLGPLSSLVKLTKLDCSHTQVADLTPLASLTKLTSLNCSMTQVTDLAPLASLTKLTRIYCSGTKVTELAPLASLADLTKLDCSMTQVPDLAPLASLANLTSLYCSDTQVTELGPLASLVNLTKLYCSDTQVAELAPLASLLNLTTLSCLGTKVAELSPLASLANLTSLNCSCTRVTELAPLASLTKLTRIYCSRTKVTQLAPLIDCSNLRILEVKNVPLKAIPVELLYASHLKHLSVSEIAGIPREVLSQSGEDNCLESFRADVRDSAGGETDLRDAKMIVIGNGRVGKTQICRRLLGLEPEPDPDSTHGIVVTSFPRDGRDDDRISLWDFGGQDIYHGTHALFMQTRAIFLIVWSTDCEEYDEHEFDGFTFRNHRLPYWLAHVRHLGKSDSPVLVIQNKCDTTTDEKVHPAADPTHFEQFDHCRLLQYSATEDRNRAALDEAINEAIEKLHESTGVIKIGTGRLAVRRQLEQWRDEDAARPNEEERRYRTITMSRFEELCEEIGSISSPHYLVEYLHNAGVVFYRKGLFDDQIILDQAWALNAIYTVLDRVRSFGPLSKMRGRFTRSLLELLAWKEYSPAEQKLFIGMMQSCGICFEHRSGDERLGIEPEYVAPDLLPTRGEQQAEIDALWQHDTAERQVTYRYPFLYQALLRGIVAAIGQEAADTAVYWKYGVCAYERTTGCHLLLEHDSEDQIRGTITIRCKGHRAEDLLAMMQKLIDAQNRRFGVDDVECDGNVTERRPRHVKLLDENPEDEVEVPKPVFADPPRTGDAKDRYYVSYAWGDDSPEGQLRKETVEKLCGAASERGIELIRDVDHVEVGDRISDFMRQLGRGDRVFVILSARYLESEFCMYELFEVWRNCQGDSDQFLSRIRAFELPCAKISTVEDRLRISMYWKERIEKITAMQRKLGPSWIGEEESRRIQTIFRFAHETNTMIEHLADVLKPRSFDELAKRGFE